MSTNVSRLAATLIAATTVTALTTAAAVAEPPAPPGRVDRPVSDRANSAGIPQPGYGHRAGLHERTGRSGAGHPR